MTDQTQAVVTYPGVVSWEDWDFTDSAGVSPSVGVMTVFPQFGFPAPVGDLVMTQDGRRVVIKNMRVDSASYVRNSNGQIVQMKLFDSRWRWQKGYWLNGRYNVRLGDNDVDPLTEKTPHELVSILFGCLEEKNFNADILKSDAAIASSRPEVNWDVAIAAQELSRLLEEFGCWVVPVRSDGSWKVCRIGDGKNLILDGSIPYQDLCQGIDPQEFPDKLDVIGSPIKYQCRLELEAVMPDVYDKSNQPQPIPDDPKAKRPTGNADGSWKPPEQMTYMPNVFMDGAYVRSWWFEDDDCSNVGLNADGSLIRILQPDGTYVVPQDLAKQHLRRCWRLKEDADGLITVPGWGPLPRRQIILSAELAELFIDPDGQKRPKPAFLDFVGVHNLLPETTVNVKGGTRLDMQTDKDAEHLDIVTFNVNTEIPTSAITSSAGIVTTSQQLFQIFTHTNDDLTEVSYIEPARVFLTCAFTILPIVTGVPFKFIRTRAVPGANPPEGGDFSAPLRHDDIIQKFITTYTIADNGDGVGRTTNNLDECNKQADYYLDAKMRELEAVTTQTVTYIGMWPIDMDGALSQISYTISGSGADTKVSRNTEHDFRSPTYKENQKIAGRNLLVLAKDLADAKLIEKKVNK